MLKKIFLGLLIMCVLSSGLLVFLLRQRGADKSPVMVKHDEESHEVHEEESHASAESSVSPEEVKTEAPVEAAAETPHVEESPIAHAAAPTPTPIPTDDKVSVSDVNTATVAEKAVEKENPVAPEAATSEDDGQSLRLLTDPLGASVFVEGEFIGSTPIDLPLKTVAIKIAIEAPGYKRFERKIPAKNASLEKGKNLFAAVMKIHLEPLKKGAAAKIAKAAAPESQPIPDEEGVPAIPEPTLHVRDENPFNNHQAKRSPKKTQLPSHKKVAASDKDFYIQAKSLPDQGPATQTEISRMTALVREKSAFAVHACRVDLGSRGRWIRVLLGPFGSQKDANENISEASKLGLDTEAPFVTGEQVCL